MKTELLLLIFLLPISGLSGQHNIFPENFPRTEGVKAVIVTRSCLECDNPTESVVSEKYFFNDKGLNTVWYSICEDGPCGKQIYNYENGNLISYKNRGTWVSTSNTGDFGMRWDSTILTNELSYEFNNDGQIINSIWIDSKENRKALEINYLYNNKGQLTKELITSYPNPNSVGTYEPNSVELIDDPDSRRLVKSYKNYEYRKDSLIIKYFKEGSLTGTEIHRLNDKGEPIMKTLMDTTGKVLRLEKFAYNQKGQLMTKTIDEKGYDGFGNPYDFLEFDKELHEYNDKGHLIIKKSFIDDKLYWVEEYEYKK